MDALQDPWWIFDEICREILCKKLMLWWTLRIIGKCPTQLFNYDSKISCFLSEAVFFYFGQGERCSNYAHDASRSQHDLKRHRILNVRLLGFQSFVALVGSTKKVYPIPVLMQHKYNLFGIGWRLLLSNKLYNFHLMEKSV